MIGHEITHGFDDQGRQYDDTGNLANWWDDATKDKFLEKANCIIWQYGNYTATAVNKTLNGVNTQVGTGGILEERSSKCGGALLHIWTSASPHLDERFSTSGGRLLQDPGEQLHHIFCRERTLLTTAG